MIKNSEFKKTRSFHFLVITIFVLSAIMFSNMVKPSFSKDKEDNPTDPTPTNTIQPTPTPTLITNPYQGDCGDGKVLICHSTSSHTNPYITNCPDTDGDVSGHDDHDGYVFPADPWGDIIPPFDYPCDGTVCHYEGKNWTEGGQAIYFANCEMVVATATPTNTPPPCEPTATPTVSETTGTPTPTNTPIPGPSNTPGPGPTETPGPGPTSTPEPARIGGVSESNNSSSVTYAQTGMASQAIMDLLSLPGCLIAAFGILKEKKSRSK